MNLNTEKVILFKSKEDCCGCSLCESVCPVQCIEMLADDQGFLYPFINYDKCIKCEKCVSVCTFNNR